MLQHKNILPHIYIQVEHLTHAFNTNHVAKYACTCANAAIHVSRTDGTYVHTRATKSVHVQARAHSTSLPIIS